MTVVNEKEGSDPTKLSISMSMSAATILVALIISSSFLLVPAEPSTSNNARTSWRTAAPSANNPKRVATTRTPGAVDALSREYLSAHNKVRQSLREPPLKWDQNLAKYARHFALKRVEDCKMIHSYGPYGENIFWGERNHWTPSQVVKLWVDENRYYDASKNQCAPQQNCRHYTQVVWLDTTRVGCANVTCKNGGMYAICSYDPKGNYFNESPFEHYSG